ncbi:hypothetical protein LR004_03110, partial [Candidatus Gracilibacteria bacterium]|nr:hypothetical protein [Candidatus Gracilibacteria bacterium]
MSSPFINTSLDTQVFQDELDFKTLENLLETLDHVEAKKISRENFNDLKGDFLLKNGQDEQGEQKYILNLPEDLKQFELAYIIDSLTTKFNIQDYANIDEIINKTKIAVSVVLRQDGGKKYLEKLVEEYNIPENFVDKIKTTKLRFGETRNFIKDIKSKRNINNLENENSGEKLENTENEDSGENKKLGKEKEDLENIFSETQKLYSEEFDLTFFRKGINMLRLGMETLTQAELQAKITYLEDNGFEKKEYGK